MLSQLLVQVVAQTVRGLLFRGLALLRCLLLSQHSHHHPHNLIARTGMEGILY